MSYSTIKRSQLHKDQIYDLTLNETNHQMFVPLFNNNNYCSLEQMRKLQQKQQQQKQHREI